MKTKSIIILLVLALVLGFTGPVMASDSNYGSLGAINDPDLTLQEMLTYAIQDEYAAHAEYQKIIEVYGQVKPFTNIIKAEAQHIKAIEPLFTTYGFELPVNDAAEHVILPTSLKESYATGVEAEIMNIDMYNKFLAEDLPDDVREVFESLKKASESHLVAFERNLNRSK